VKCQKQVAGCHAANDKKKRFGSFSIEYVWSIKHCVLTLSKKKLTIKISTPSKAHVICNETSMTVELDKSSFKGLSEDHLRLNDPSNTACSLHSNSTHIIGVIPLNACGTQIEVM